MTSTDTEDSLYIRLIDETGKKSVERHLDVEHKRGEWTKHEFCTPRDEDLDDLEFVELHQRAKDTWYMDKVSLFENSSSFPLIQSHILMYYM